MAYSVYQNPEGIDWPLGFVAVPTLGTPVNIMVNVDPANNNSPENANWQTSSTYTPRCHKVTFQSLKPQPANNGMTMCTGNVYILRAPSGGAGNRTDPGAMVYVLQPGGSVTIPCDESDRAGASPYRYFLDADVAGEGSLVTLLGCSKGG